MDIIMNEKQTNEIIEKIPKLAVRFCSTEWYFSDYRYRIRRFINRPMMDALEELATSSNDKKLKRFVKLYKEYLTNLYNSFTYFYSNGKSYTSIPDVRGMTTTLDNMYRQHLLSKSSITPSRVCDTHLTTSEDLRRFAESEAYTLQSALVEDLLKRGGGSIGYSILGLPIVESILAFTASFVVILITTGRLDTALVGSILTSMTISLSMFCLKLFSVKDIRIEPLNESIIELTRGEETLARVESVNIGIATDLNLDSLDILVPGNLLTNLEMVLDTITPIAEDMYSRKAINTLPSEINPKSPKDVEKYIMRLSLIVSVYNRGLQND